MRLLRQYYLLFAVVALMIILLYRTVWKKRGSDSQEMAIGFFSVFTGHIFSSIFFILSCGEISLETDSWGVSSLGIFIGLLSLYQLTYVLPGLVVASFQRRPGVVKGILIGVTITLLLSFSSCGTLPFELLGLLKK